MKGSLSIAKPWLKPALPDLHPMARTREAL
jgi:hypothetical protein